MFVISYAVNVKHIEAQLVMRAIVCWLCPYKNVKSIWRTGVKQAQIMVVNNALASDLFLEIKSILIDSL